MIGEYLSTGHQGDGGGGHHREGEEEDGSGPSGHSENGHHRSDCAGQQLWEHKVRCQKSSGLQGLYKVLKVWKMLNFNQYVFKVMHMLEFEYIIL